ncbi:MAG: peptidoglycan synthetase [Bacteroidia bacterium]|nr:peptidoglycan synthetase [Bacteroidia bacterium]
MKVHIIACGGAVMHNMAIALHQMGYQVTGSDDEIFDPALSRLRRHGLAPNAFGWFPEKINDTLDFIILGMHARKDNPELQRAKELGIKIYSFPEYVYEHAKNKTRIVIGGSHGKTTSTAMIMHVLMTLGKDFDYLVGSQLEGFDTMVKFSDAPIMVIEGDEYLTSALDPVPKFHKYKPQIAMITGIAWDHINVFPTFENYVEQFKIFIDSIEDSGHLAYFSGDPILEALSKEAKVQCTPYSTPHFHIRNGHVVVSLSERYELEIFGEHNLQNAEGARKVCEFIGIKEHEFYKALATFKGTSKRLEKVHEDSELIVFRDFAHSPSKLKATVEAVRSRFSDAYIIAVFELHTFSSLNKDFLPHYAQSMEKADQELVYFNPHVFESKKMDVLDNQYIEKCFGSKTEAISQINDLKEKITKFRSNVSGQRCVLLLMSSGNFDNTQLW